MRTIYLVSCVKTKKSGNHPAKDLYISPWFKKAKALAEREGDSWFILSAKYGVVDPDSIIASYEKTLCGMPSHERREWAVRVLESLEQMIELTDHVVVLAGKDYREFMLEGLTNMCARVSIPMEHLSQGRQMSFLKGRNANSEQA